MLLSFQAEDKTPLSTAPVQSSEAKGTAESDASLTEGRARLTITAPGLIPAIMKGGIHGGSRERRRSSLEDVKASWRTGNYTVRVR